MHPEVGVYLQMEDWNDDDVHPNYVEMSTRRTLRFILQVLNYLRILHGTIVLDIFFISHQSKLKAVAHLSSLSTWYSQADPGLGPYTTGAIIPRRQAEALHRRALAGREAHLGTNHPNTLQSMHNLAELLWKQGKLAEAGLRVFRVRGDLTGRFTKRICLFGQGLRPGFSLVNFPILLDYLFWA